MNARMYDPMLGRMCAPDNLLHPQYGTQGFNRYSYALNNPLKYTDPTGEFVWFVPLIYAAVNVGIDLALNNGKMTFGEIALSAVTGAVGGALSGATTVAGAIVGAGVSQVNRFMPNIPLYQSQSFSLGISPMIGLGSSGFNFGASLNASGQAGDFVWSASVGAGYNSGVSSLGDGVGGSGYWNGGGFLGYNDGHANYGAGYAYNSFGGRTAQGIGAISAQVGDFGLRFDEDFFGDGGDRYRTGGLLATYRVNSDVTLAVGGSMMTGWHQGKPLPGGNPNSAGGLGLYDNCNENCYNLRGGTFYGGVIYKGQAYLGGSNSERRLHDVQNAIHRNWPIRTSPYFESRAFQNRFYSYYGAYHPNYLFY